MHYQSDEYRNALNNAIINDKDKVRAMGIDPDALINSIYDVLNGKKPLYEGMEFTDDNVDDYFVKYNDNIEYEHLV